MQTREAKEHLVNQVQQITRCSNFLKVGVFGSITKFNTVDGFMNRRSPDGTIERNGSKATANRDSEKRRVSILITTLISIVSIVLHYLGRL